MRINQAHKYGQTKVLKYTQEQSSSVEHIPHTHCTIFNYCTEMTIQPHAILEISASMSQAYISMIFACSAYYDTCTCTVYIGPVCCAHEQKAHVHVYIACMHYELSRHC